MLRTFSARKMYELKRMSLGKLSCSQSVCSTNPESCGIHNFVGRFSAVKLSMPMAHVAVIRQQLTMNVQGFLHTRKPHLFNSRSSISDKIAEQESNLLIKRRFVLQFEMWEGAKTEKRITIGRWCGNTSKLFHSETAGEIYEALS